MLAIRMQRTGRKGHAMFRVVVQDSRRTPTSGKVVAALGSYDPHAKSIILDKEKATFYLVHGAQPSDRVARLLKQEGIKLPNWVDVTGKKTGVIRDANKLRRNRPAEEASTEPEVAPSVDEPSGTPVEAPAAETAVASEEAVAEPEATPAAEQTPEAEAPSEPEATEPSVEDSSPAEDA
jgi:small subunit ribosomal protein S16